MGDVHDDEAIHQFRVPLDHIPEERETEESVVMVAYSFHTALTNNRRLQYPPPHTHTHTSPSSPCDQASPVMGHEGAGGVAEGWDQFHYVLPQEINLVVLLVGGTLRVTVAP